MKKLLLSSIVLFLFSLSIVVFQISCKKEIKAQSVTADGLKQLGKVLYRSNSQEYWLINYDGTGKQKLNIAVPSGETAINYAKLSPDGKRVFIITYKKTGQTEVFHLYSSNLDGSDLKKVIQDDSLDAEEVGVY